MDTLDLPALVRVGERRIRGRVIREFIVVIVWLVVLFLMFVVAQPSPPPVPFAQLAICYLAQVFALLVAILDVGVRLWPQLLQSQRRSQEVRQLIKQLVPDLQVSDAKQRQSTQLLALYGFAVMLFVGVGANLALRDVTDDAVVFVRTLVGGGLLGYICFRLLTTPGLLRYFIGDFRVLERYFNRGEYEYVLERTEYNAPESKRRDFYRQYQARALLLAGRFDEAQALLLKMLPLLYQSGATAGFAAVAYQIGYMAMVERRYDDALVWQSAAIQAAPEWELMYLGMVEYHLFSWSYPERLREYMAAVERLLAARALIPMSAASRASYYLTLANGAAFCGDHDNADAYFSLARSVIPKKSPLMNASMEIVAGYMALYRGDRERAREVFASNLARHSEGLNGIIAREGLARCDSWSPDAINREEAAHE